MFEHPEIEGGFRGRKIAWGFSGGIAAFKACQAMRLFIHEGAEVRAAMTEAATRFVGELTVTALSGAPVLTDVLEPSQDALYGHLDLARHAELMVVAPATADVLARLAQGMANCAVTTTVLAVRCPVLIAPAMNVAMWENPAVQRNVEILKSYGRYHFVGPAAGLLADGDVGFGRLAEPWDILEAARGVLAKKDWMGRKVVITSGPTREHLDPVRFLSNPSTGRMGHALARAARDRGADVVLVTGPTNLPDPHGIQTVHVVSADEMLEAVNEAVEGADAFIAAAAVADQKSARIEPQKVKKAAAAMTLALVPTPDVLATVAARVREWKERPVLVGFAAETESLVENATKKLREKGLDLIVANHVGVGAGGFETNVNEAVLVAEGAPVEPLSLRAKRELADAILDRAHRFLRERS